MASTWTSADAWIKDHGLSWESDEMRDRPRLGALWNGDRARNGLAPEPAPHLGPLIMTPAAARTTGPKSPATRRRRPAPPPAEFSS